MSKLALSNKSFIFVPDFNSCIFMLFFSRIRVVNGSWDRECGRGLRLYQSEIVLKRWYIVFPNIVERDVNRFVNRAIELARNMGFEITKPRL